MKVAKWGNSLAVHLPADLIRKLDLKEGDRVEIIPGKGALEIRRQPRAEEVLETLRRFRGRLPAANRLGRDAAHER